MFVAGYSFYVLNNAFVNHWGFQYPHGIPEWRVEQRTENEIKFENFAREISARYGRDPLKMVDKLSEMNTTEIIHKYAKNPPLPGYE